MKKGRAAGAWVAAQSQLSASTLGFCKCPGTCCWRVKKKASGHLAETGKDAALPQLFSVFLHWLKERQALAGAKST